MLLWREGHRRLPISPMSQSCYGAESSLLANFAHVAKLFWREGFHKRHLTKEQIQEMYVKYLQKEFIENEMQRIRFEFKSPTNILYYSYDNIIDTKS